MTEELERGAGPSRNFDLAHDVSLRVLDRLHLARPDGTPRTLVLVALAWLPLCFGGLVPLAFGQPPAPILFDLSVHARLLIGIPLFVRAGQLLAIRCDRAVEQLYRGEFAERAAVDRIVDRAERLRDSHLFELLMFVLVFAGAQALLWGLVGPSGVFGGLLDVGELSFARLWYVSVSWPLTQFLVLRWLWHWAIWSYVLARLARLPLATIATHPDRAAGIGFLGGPLAGFSGFVLSVSVVLASAWGTQILDGRAVVQAFVPSFLTFVVVSMVIACGPLLLFVPMLYRARHREIGAYNLLALDYVRSFHRKWIDARPGGEALLGTPDLQSLNDLLGTCNRSRLMSRFAHAGCRC
jgi:hypothetical protein